MSGETIPRTARGVGAARAGRRRADGEGVAGEHAHVAHSHVMGLRRCRGQAGWRVLAHYGARATGVRRVSQEQFERAMFNAMIVALAVACVLLAVAYAVQEGWL